MAVVINGTTGIDKVQDGSIGTADIAADAITTPKIASSVNLGRRNLIINGAMQVAQRSTSVASSDSSNEGFVALDRWSWRWNNGMSGQATLSQSTDAPAGFANSWKAAVTTANGTMRSGTSDWCYFYQPIEAQNLQHLNYGTGDAKTITLSFYAKRVGTWGPISVGLQTQDGTPEFINSSIELNTTWTRHTVTFVGSTTATINNDSGSGMGVFFSVAGSQTGSFTGAASSSWSTTRQDFDNQIGNFLASTSNNFYITGVQLEVGDTATPFEHRLYGEELSLCQRYFQRKVVPQDYNDSHSNTAQYSSYDLANTMRSDGTVSVRTQIRYWTNGTAANITPNLYGYPNHILMTATTLSNGRGWIDGEVNVDSEL